ncbi:TPA: hypothetical protein ACQUHP_006218 [Bacillus cereus]
MNQQNDSNKTEIADSLKVAFLGGLFSTIGEILEAYAAKLAIDETVKHQNSPSKTDKKQDEKIMLLQKQIYELQQQIENFKI